jgi:uncharacterized protein with von Willebrand factor type A (vWA) domain
MDLRIIEFVNGLRAAGVRVSIAECEDAFKATRYIGVSSSADFRESLRTTLVKEVADHPVFDQLFPLYFGSDEPPMLNINQELSPEEQQMLRQALRALLEQLRQQAELAEQNEQQQGRPRWQRQQPPTSQQLNNLMELLRSLLQGQPLPQEKIEQAGEQAGLQQARRPYEQRAAARDMLRQLGMQLLEQLMEQLPDQLKQVGMSQEAIDQLMADMEANQEALAEQLGHYVGSEIARQRTEEYLREREEGSDLMHRPFERLTEQEAKHLKDELKRLVSQLRSRAALRRKRNRDGSLDTKRTIRANLRYGGVPLELKYKNRSLKPKLLLICDMSTSMRPVVSFFLRIIYELQDQVTSTHTFGFVSDLGNITEDFAQHPPDKALDIVLRRPDLQPGYYSTDLGNSLNSLAMDHADTIDHRTTVIFVGDGRNNFRDPRLDLMEQIQRRSKRIIWLNPEHPMEWGHGDSDMPKYLPYAAAVHRVSNMAELTAAIDKLLTVS